jgi:ABC-type branched-subunit amino acid transport system substrate-binding protein
MKKRVLSILIAAILLFAIAACGSGTSSDTSPPPPPPSDLQTATNTDNSETPNAPTPTPDAAPKVENAQGVTDTEILIANSLPISGPWAVTGVPTKAGLEAYIRMVNETGGINGRKIRYIHQDDEADPMKGKPIVQSFINDDKVFAIVECFGTAVVGAIIDDLREVGIPTVYFGTGIGQLYAENATTNAEGLNTFPVQPIYTTEGQIMIVRGVGDFNAAKIGIIYTNDDAGKDMLRGAEKKCKELGIDFKSEQVAVNAPDVSAAVTSIKDFAPDFIVCASIQATMPTIVKELASQGIKVPVITSYVNASGAMAEAVASDITGKFDLYASGWLDYSTEERAANLALYQEWVDEEYQFNSYAQCGWIAGYFFCEGLRRLEGQGITWENYIKAMEQAPIDIPFGGTIDYSGGKRMGTPALSMFKVNMELNDGFNWELAAPLESINEILAKTN